MSTRIAYLGPTGTYTEEAALKYDGEAVLVPFQSIPAAIGAVDDGKADEAVVPIENSLEGAVTYTLDVLIHGSMLSIRDEIVLPIHHCLLAKKGTEARGIETVYSHPQSLAQCRSYLEKNFPNASLVASLSNSTAVEEMKGDGASAAAIAGQRNAEIYDVEILERNVEDNPNNMTRFVVLAKDDHERTGVDKTSLCFDFSDDSPGILVSVLEEFSSRGINLNKIESRPTRKSLGRYIFLVDIDGHRDDPDVKDALEALRGQASMVKVFGSYPRQVSSSI